MDDDYGFQPISLVGAEAVTYGPCPFTKSGNHPWIDNGSDCAVCGYHRTLYSPSSAGSKL